MTLSTVAQESDPKYLDSLWRALTAIDALLSGHSFLVLVRRVYTIVRAVIISRRHGCDEVRGANHDGSFDFMVDGGNPLPMLCLSLSTILY